MEHDGDARPLEQLAVEGALITSLPFGSFTASYDLLDGMSSEQAVGFLGLHGCATDARVHATAFAIETDDHLVMVDAGMGAGSVLGSLDESLRVAGIDHHRIDSVVLTHLHPDHADGLLDGSFAQATVYVPAAEVAFARDRDAIAASGPFVSKDYANAARVLDAVGDRLVPFPATNPSATQLPAGLTPIPLPGHSPGHTGYRLGTSSDEIIFIGDLLHFPDLQGRRPQVSVLPDIDRRLAAKTRQQMIDHAAVTGTILAGAHLGPRGFRRVMADDTGTRLS